MVRWQTSGRLIVLALLLATVLAVLLPLSVLAADPPDSISIDTVYVNRNLIETDDMLFYAVYTITYTVLPDEDIDELFTFRLTDTDGVTELGANEAYPYNNQGYGTGVISFYFSAADAAALVWGSNYYIRVQGKPGFFGVPPDESFIIDANDYTSETTQEANREEVYNNIVSICQTLEADWSPVTLLTEIETGTVFDTDGETYFRNAINGIQAMCPALFETQIVDPEYTERTWNTTQQTTYEGRMTGTTPGNAIQGLATIFSLDFNLVASLPLLAGCVLCIVAASKLNGKPEAGFLCCAIMILAGGFMGWTPFAIIAIGSIACFLYIALALIGKVPT